MTTLSLEIPLPSSFRPSGVLHYYGRDKIGTSEKAWDDGFEKSFWVCNAPAHVLVRFRGLTADVKAVIDAKVDLDYLNREILEVVSRILGLAQPISEFESLAKADPVLSEMIAKTKGLRVPQTVSPWEALISSVIGQQVSVAAATSIRSRFIGGLGSAHSSGMFCFPSATCVADLGAERLLEFGISTAKSNTIFSLAEKVKLGQLSLERPVFTEKQSAEFSRELISFKGVGPWTVNYTFLRGYAFLDGSLHGDAVIRKQVAKLMGKAQIPICDVQDWLMKYRPWRGLLAAHLWALA